MITDQQHFMPILFKVLFGFVILNMIVNFVLLMIRKERMYKLLALFWPMVLAVFIFQAANQEGHLNIVLAYSTTLIPMSIFGKIAFEVVGRRFPVFTYIAYYALFYPITFVLYQHDVSFTILAMPFAVATATPLFHSAMLLLVLEKNRSTKLQKLLGTIAFIWSIHCFNFAFFRMDPGAQLWGWLVAYALYDTLAVLLPSIALEEANMTENVRLQKLVQEKTSHLNSSLKENEKLIKILLHDISNPLTLLNWYMQMLTTQQCERDEVLPKMKKAHQAIETIVLQVKDLYAKKKPELVPVSVEECFKDISFLFAEALEKKNIKLKLQNNLPPGTMILADKASLTHSVLSNLVSNGLKFSAPSSQIEVSAFLQNANVVLEVRDKGPGIPKEVINGLMRNEVLPSSLGTNGEKGSGFGLTIVKSYVESFGGNIEFESQPLFTNPSNHGTNVRITLGQA